jgi:hypothetical protein
MKRGRSAEVQLSAFRHGYVIARSDLAPATCWLTITKCSMHALPDRYPSRDVIAITIVELILIIKI